MKLACLARYSDLRAALSFAALASIASGQDQTWILQFGTSTFDRAMAAAPDGAGGVFVSGDTTGSLGAPNAGINDAWLAHFDGGGNQTWIRQLGMYGDDTLSAAAPDGAGGVYVSGHTHTNLGGPIMGNLDVRLARFDGAGNQTWIQQFGSAGSSNYPRAVAPDGAGGVHVGGSTNRSLGGPHTGSYDA